MVKHVIACLLYVGHGEAFRNQVKKVFGLLWRLVSLFFEGRDQLSVSIVVLGVFVLHAVLCCVVFALL